MSAPVVDDPVRHRLVARADTEEAELVYDRGPELLYLLHTRVPPALEGQGLGSQLVLAAMELARENGLVVVPWCPFARRWLREHSEQLEGDSIDWTILPPSRTERDRGMDEDSSTSPSPG